MRQAIKDWRILLLFAAILVSILIISPRMDDGVEITYIEFNSSAWDSGLQKGMVIESVNGVRVRTPMEFYSAVSEMPADQVVIIGTEKKEYNIFTRNVSFGVEVQQAPPTEIRFGLDLQGGTRVFARPVTDSQSKNVTEATKSVLEARLNSYGLQDVKTRTVRDSENNWLIQMEMAGPGSDRILNVIRNVGVFEVKILNQTIFTGDQIASVGASQAQRQGGYGVPFTVKRDAARDLRDAYVSAADSQGSCASQEDCGSEYLCVSHIGLCRPLIKMYLDGEIKFSAPANENLYQSWTGGVLQQEMVVSVGTPEMSKAIEAVMRSGTLPEGVTGVEIISRDFVDATLGRDFVRSAVIAGIAALLAVTLVVLIRYRSFKIASAIMFTGISEVILLLGIAATIKLDLDLASIAGIIAAVGTGVDQQVIIADEILSGKVQHRSLTQQLKRAFSIIILAATTTFVTMAPLVGLGLGLIRGFAIMTIFGVLSGFLIARPAFGRMLTYMLKE